MTHRILLVEDDDGSRVLLSDVLALDDALSAGYLVLPKPISRRTLAGILDDALETKA